MIAEKLLLALRSRGIDSTDLRHAVHEAHHALEAKVPEGKWETWTIDRAVKRMGPGRAAASEIAARAVEQVICERLGVPTKPLEDWVGTSVMEAIKFGDPFLSYTDALDAAKRRMASLQTKLEADRIMALAEVPFPKPKRKRATRNASLEQEKK